MTVLARLTFAESDIDAAHVLTEARKWLKFKDEDETRLYRCYLD